MSNGSVEVGCQHSCHCGVSVAAFLLYYLNSLSWPLLQEERKKRLGPGGLDPLEVMETLPPVSETLSLFPIPWCVMKGFL